MVAISIDKYMAIMYPMRLRMPKTQAKIIILVIWSLALLTSLPTALLSELAEVYPDSYTPATTTTSASSNLEQTPRGANSTLSPPVVTTMLEIAPTTLKMTTPDSHRPQIIPSAATTTPKIPTTTSSSYKDDGAKLKREEKISFCQENWDRTWQNGKYYYSMALMILQFVLPLFVLVITYTRIVIVVWGKRMPGEEDNVRDARMARSKRKVNIR